MKVKVNRVTIEIVQDDLLALTVGAVVNSTDTNLYVSPALSERAGPSIEQKCAEIGWCAVGSAVMTDGGNLPAQRIIHAVGPRWGEGSERGKLSNVTLECLRLAEQNRLKSVALPAIATGALGYPIENCAKTMLALIIDFTFENPRYLKTVIICLDTPEAYTIFKQELMQQVEDVKLAGDAEVSV